MNDRTPNEQELRRRLQRDLGEAGASAKVDADLLARILVASPIAVDDAGMARRALGGMRPELARRRSADLHRQVLVRVMLAVVPLPFVVAYAVYVLRALYVPVAALLTPDLAAYVAVVHIMLLTLLFGVTYAAIPMMLSRSGNAGHPPAAA